MQARSGNRTKKHVHGPSSGEFWYGGSRGTGRGGKEIKGGKTVAIFRGQYTKMSNQKKKQRVTARKNVWVEPAGQVWGTPITPEAKEWTMRHLEAKLLKEHDGKLTHDAAVALAKRDKRVERYVKTHGLEMQAADMACVK